MCGISGCVGAHEPGTAFATDQLDLLEHRGPDARGSFRRPGAVIAQNRLAIIDL